MRAQDRINQRRAYDTLYNSTYTCEGKDDEREGAEGRPRITTDEGNLVSCRIRRKGERQRAALMVHCRGREEAGDGWDVDDAEEPPVPPLKAAIAAAEAVEVKDEFGLGAPELGALSLVALDFELG